MTVGSKTQEDRFGIIAEAVFAQVRRGIPPNVDCDIALDSRLDEIGLDSLARMDVLNRLEEAFGLRFSEDALYDMATCRDMIEYIEANANVWEFALEARCTASRTVAAGSVEVRNNPC